MCETSKMICKVVVLRANSNARAFNVFATFQQASSSMLQMGYVMRTSTAVILIASGNLKRTVSPSKTVTSILINTVAGSALKAVVVTITNG